MALLKSKVKFSLPINKPSCSQSSERHNNTEMPVPTSSKSRRSGEASGNSTSLQRWGPQRRRTRPPWCSCRTAGNSSHTALSRRLHPPSHCHHDGCCIVLARLFCTGLGNSCRFGEILQTICLHLQTLFNLIKLYSVCLMRTRRVQTIIDFKSLYYGVYGLAIDFGFDRTTDKLATNNRISHMRVRFVAFKILTVWHSNK